MYFPFLLEDEDGLAQGIFSFYNGKLYRMVTLGREQRQPGQKKKQTRRKFSEDLFASEYSVLLYVPVNSLL